MDTTASQDEALEHDKHCEIIRSNSTHVQIDSNAIAHRPLSLRLQARVVWYDEGFSPGKIDERRDKPRRASEKMAFAFPPPPPGLKRLFVLENPG